MHTHHNPCVLVLPFPSEHPSKGSLPQRLPNDHILALNQHLMGLNNVRVLITILLWRLGSTTPQSHSHTLPLL